MKQSLYKHIGQLSRYINISLTVHYRTCTSDYRTVRYAPE